MQLLAVVGIVQEDDGAALHQLAVSIFLTSSSPSAACELRRRRPLAAIEISWPAVLADPIVGASIKCIGVGRRFMRRNDGGSWRRSHARGRVIQMEVHQQVVDQQCRAAAMPSAVGSSGMVPN